MCVIDIQSIMEITIRTQINVNHVSEHILTTKTNVCVHSVPLQPSDGAALMNMSVFKMRFLLKTLITLPFSVVQPLYF